MDVMVDNLYQFFIKKQTEAEFTPALRAYLPFLMCHCSHVPMEDNVNLDDKAEQFDNKSKKLKDLGVDNVFVNFLDNCAGASRAIKKLKEHENALLEAEYETNLPEKMTNAFNVFKNAIQNPHLISYRSVRKGDVTNDKDVSDGIDLYCQEVESLWKKKNDSIVPAWFDSAVLKSWLEEFSGHGWFPQHKGVAEKIQKAILSLQSAEELDNEGKYEDAQKIYAGVPPLTFRIYEYKKQRLKRSSALCDENEYSLSKEFCLVANKKWKNNDGFKGRPDSSDNSDYGDIEINEARFSMDWVIDDDDKEIAIKPGMKKGKKQEPTDEWWFSWNKDTQIEIKLYDNDSGDSDDLFWQKTFDRPQALRQLAEALGLDTTDLGFPCKNDQWPQKIVIIDRGILLERRPRNPKEFEAELRKCFNDAIQNPGIINDVYNGGKILLH